jgi:branched-chain amino acid transport system ATP-binding protein
VTAARPERTLTVEDLSVRYGGVNAVRSVSFSVPAGHSVGLIGANGAGKTSTLRALMGLVPRASGKVSFGDRDLTKVSARDMVRLGIGYVPEGRHVFGGLSVEKNLLLGAYARGWGSECRQTLDQVYGLFGMLADMRGRLAGALSGGQQQMLAIGRALMCDPALMLLDEPSMGLSPKLVEVILDALQRLRRDGLSMLLVEQNAMLTFEVTTQCLVMENGEVAMSGTSEQLRRDPRVRRVYLGLLPPDRLADTVRAVVLSDPGDPLRSLRVVDDWAEPEAGPGQVLVGVRGVGICGSDLALAYGHWALPAVPWVPGHETFGEIIATGAGVDPGRTGQRVVIEPNIPCLACPACLAGLTSACANRTSLGFSAPGTLAERVAVPAEFAWEVPDDWTDTDAVCAEPLTVALAAIRRVPVEPGRRCLVIGAGSQGALLCVALVAQGVTTYVLEPHPGRRRLAEELGARPAGPAGAGGGDFDVVFETSGTAAALTSAVDRVAVGGTVVLIGLNSLPAPLATETVVRRQLRIQGSLTYDHPGDFAATIKLAGPELRPSRVLRACYPLAETAAAFRAAREAPGKTWISLTS